MTLISQSLQSLEAKSARKPFSYQQYAPKLIDADLQHAGNTTYIDFAKCLSCVITSKITCQQKLMTLNTATLFLSLIVSVSHHGCEHDITIY